MQICILVQPRVLNYSAINLLAEGIDTVSTISINNVVVGKTENQFVRYVFDIKKVLKTGKNSIRVQFQSAIAYGKIKWEEFKNKYHYNLNQSKSSNT